MCFSESIELSFGFIVDYSRIILVSACLHSSPLWDLFRFSCHIREDHCKYVARDVYGLN